MTFLNNLTRGGCSNSVPLNSTDNKILWKIKCILKISIFLQASFKMLWVSWLNILQSLGCALISKKEKIILQCHKILRKKTHANIERVYRKRLFFKQCFTKNLPKETTATVSFTNMLIYVNAAGDRLKGCACRRSKSRNMLIPICALSKATSCPHLQNRYFQVTGRKLREHPSPEKSSSSSCWVHLIWVFPTTCPIWCLL